MEASRADFKIMNGATVEPPNLFPWIAVLHSLVKGQEEPSICGGTLISKKDVVSAVHCKFDNKEKKFKDFVTVFLGVTKDYITMVNQTTNTNVFDAPHVSFHPDFDKKDSLITADLAVYHLKGGLTSFSSLIRPICLPILTENTGGELYIVGFGIKRPKDENPSEKLQMASDVKITSQDACKELIHAKEKYLNNFICGKSETAGHCSGDSGGPLMKRYGNKWVIIGVISSGRGKCNKGHVDGFANVITGVKWIKSVVKGNLNELNKF